MNTDLAARFLSARTATNTSIKTAAKEMGVAFSALTRMNRGERISPRLTSIVEDWIARHPEPEPADPTEEWRPIPGWDGFYEASSHGRVRSLTRTVKHPKSGAAQIQGRVLRTGPHRSGHLWVELCRPGVKKTRQVHQLVLEAFVGPKPPGMEGCHYDGNPQNNRIENLRWDTRAGNLADAIRHGTFHNLGLWRRNHMAALQKQAMVPEVGATEQQVPQEGDQK